MFSPDITVKVISMPFSKVTCSTLKVLYYRLYLLVKFPVWTSIKLVSMPFSNVKCSTLCKVLYYRSYLSVKFPVWTSIKLQGESNLSLDNRSR